MNNSIKYLKILLFLLPLFFVSCGNEEEPEENLFSLAVQLQGEGEIALGVHDCEVVIPGNAQYVKLTLLGDYDSFNISAGYPSWMLVTSGDKTISISVADIADAQTRTGTVAFTVFKGKSHNTGSITITQKDAKETFEDLLKLESEAIDEYLKGKSVIDQMPEDNNFQTGTDAPFYKLDKSGAYMQVLAKGNPQFNNGEKVYFRFERWSLIHFLLSGSLGESTGNFSSITQDVTYFNIGGQDNVTKQWGDGIQLPTKYGVGNGGEVNIIIPSQIGFSDETSSVKPYLFHIRYFGADN